MVSARSLWALFILLLPLALAVLWCWASDYAGVNGQDAHDYWRIAREWTAYWGGGERPVMAEHPHGYPITGAVLGAVFGDELAGLRAVSALSLLLLAFSLRWMLSGSSVERGPLLAFVLLSVAACPFMLRYGMMSMSDVPGIALIFLAYVMLVRSREAGASYHILLAIMLAVVAMMVRMAVAPLIGALMLASLYEVERARRVLWAFLISALVLLLVLVVFTDKGSAAEGLLHGTPLAEWSPLNFFRRVLHSDDGVLVYRVPNIIYVLGIFVHPGFLPVGILLLPFFRKTDLFSVRARMAAWCVACYLLFIAGMPFQNDRVLLMALPFVAVLLFPAFQRAWAWLAVKGWRPALWISTMIVVQFGLFARALQPFMDQAHTERELAAQVNGLHPSRIYTHGMGAAFTNYCAPVPVTELWYAVIDTFQHGAVVVVKPQNLVEQWSGLPPGLNWQRIEVQGMDSIGSYPDGWMIARIR